MQNKGINSKESLTRSDYIFCLDKLSHGAGLHEQYKRLGLNLDYKKGIENYDGEKERDKSFNVKASVKF